MTLTIMRGISGSGKSKYAVEDTDALIVSRDIIRLQFGAEGKTVLSSDEEKLVTLIERDQVREALYRNCDVVLDDTNLNNSNVRHFMNLAHALGHEYYVIEMTDSYDLGLCISRSDIPESAVTAQHKKWLKRKPVEATVERIEPIEMPSSISVFDAYIFDMDGTLAHIDPDNPRDVYDGSRAQEDLCHAEVARIARALDSYGAYVMVVSGRSEEHRQVTIDWLLANDIQFDGLFMRSAGDKRPDAQVKYELLQKIVADGFRVTGVFDDREQVVNMWRTAGVKVFDVGQGVSKF